MNIMVCIKQVPDNSVVPKLDPATGRVVKEGVETMVSPFDLNAVEAGLKLAEEQGGEVSVITVGDDACKTSLRIALSMGAAKAYLVSDPALEDSDTFATAYTLAEAVKKIEQYDLLLFGQHSADGDTAQVGAAVAAFLGIPQVTLACSLECRDGWAYCDRALGDSIQLVRAKFPAAVMVTADINEPPYASPLNILAALDKPITVLDAAELGVDISRTGILGSPSVTKRVFAPAKGDGSVEFFTGSVKDMAVKFVDMLASEHLI